MTDSDITHQLEDSMTDTGFKDPTKIPDVMRLMTAIEDKQARTAALMTQLRRAIIARARAYVASQPATAPHWRLLADAVDAEYLRQCPDFDPRRRPCRDPGLEAWLRLRDFRALVAGKEASREHGH